MIEVQGLTKSYGTHLAIDHLNFKVAKGEVVGFLGPNGAGKSTTMKIITGFMAPSSGSAQVCGFDVFESPLEVKKRIGYLPEIPPVYSDMFVRDYLRFVAELKGVEKNRVESQVSDALEKTNLQSVANRIIQNLSKGFKQRVGIAQALVSNPEVLILDEPTVGLDPKQVAEIRQLILSLRGQHTIILSTHILSEVQATCERIIIINRGKIVAEDSLANLSNLQKGVRKVNLKVKRDSSALITDLQKIHGVLKVQADPQHRLMLETHEDDEVIEKIAQSVLQSKAGLLEISSAKADLEDIFIKLTYDAQEKAKGNSSEVQL
jgi:ABC-2 type transport system ATP-binding protein